MKKAFTMAEILLSLTIIGVVAAITLPSLTGNINERTWNTQRKALYARMSQAIALMPALNGYGKIEGATSSTSAVDTATETFVANGLSKVLKINNICSKDNFPDCGISSQINTLAGTPVNVPKTLHDLNDWFKDGVSYSAFSYTTKNADAVAFETQNGESIVAYYNRTCRTDFIGEENATIEGGVVGFPTSNMCVNFVYDLNGSKGPNTVGKDIGIITVFNSMDSTVVAPVFASNGSSGNWATSVSACTKQDAETRIPNIEELSALLINKKLYNFPIETGTWFWSSTVTRPTEAWGVHGNVGVRSMYSKDSNKNYLCIRR